MTPIDRIKEACEKFNKSHEQKIISMKSYHDIPTDVTSQMCYNMSIDPISIGSREDFLDGKYDDVLEHYRQKLQTEFEDHAKKLGLIPTVSLEEYMSPEFSVPPKPLYEDLKERAETLSNYIVNLSSQINDTPLPRELVEAKIAHYQEELEKTFLRLRNKEYCTSKKDQEYADNYHKRQDEYYSLFK